MVQEATVVSFRLPVKHCTLNPIELAWAGMKDYVRKNNASFRLTDVERLASEWMAALDPATAKSYIAHAEKHELVFRQADEYIERIEEELIDDDDDNDQNYQMNISASTRNQMGSDTSDDTENETDSNSTDESEAETSSEMDEDIND